MFFAACLGSKWRDGWFGSVTFLRSIVKNWNNHFSYGSICFKVVTCNFLLQPWKQMFIPFVLEMTHILLPSLDSRKGFHLHIIYWRSANQACFLPMQAKTLSSLSLFIISDSYKFQTVHVFGNSDLRLNLNLTFCLVSAFEINDIVLKLRTSKSFWILHQIPHLERIYFYLVGFQFFLVAFPGYESSRIQSRTLPSMQALQMQPICYWIMGLGLRNLRCPGGPGCWAWERKDFRKVGKVLVGELFLHRSCFSFFSNMYVIYKVDFLNTITHKDYHIFKKGYMNNWFVLWWNAVFFSVHVFLCVYFWTRLRGAKKQLVPFRMPCWWQLEADVWIPWHRVSSRCQKRGWGFIAGKTCFWGGRFATITTWDILLVLSKWSKSPPI